MVCQRRRPSASIRGGGRAEWVAKGAAATAGPCPAARRWRRDRQASPRTAHFQLTSPQVARADGLGQPSPPRPTPPSAGASRLRPPAGAHQPCRAGPSVCRPASSCTAGPLRAPTHAAPAPPCAALPASCTARVRTRRPCRGQPHVGCPIPMSTAAPRRRPAGAPDRSFGGRNAPARGPAPSHAPSPEPAGGCHEERRRRGPAPWRRGVPRCRSAPPPGRMPPPGRLRIGRRRRIVKSARDPAAAGE